MKNKKTSLDDIIARTMDALMDAGLKCQYVWGIYNRHYTQLSKYCRGQGIDGYDLSAIEAFMKVKEDQYHTSDIFVIHMCEGIVYQTFLSDF